MENYNRFMKRRNVIGFSFVIINVIFFIVGAFVDKKPDINALASYILTFTHADFFIILNMVNLIAFVIWMSTLSSTIKVFINTLLNTASVFCIAIVSAVLRDYFQLQIILNIHVICLILETIYFGAVIINEDGVHLFAENEATFKKYQKADIKTESYDGSLAGIIDFKTAEREILRKRVFNH